MDQFDALVAGAPTDSQTQMALAAALRRQNILGQMGQATGDRALAPVGENLSNTALKGAQDISGERARQAAQTQALQFHQDEQTDQANSLAERKREADQTNTRSLEETRATNALKQTLLTQQEGAASSLAAQKAQEKADAAQQAAQHGGKPIPDGEFQKLSAYKDAAESVQQSLNSFKPEYAGAGSVVGRNAKNWMASNIPGLAGATGLVSPTDQEANNWFQNYGRGFTMDEMHNKFGARISPTEQATFEKYHITPNMDAPTIVTNLTQIGTQAAKKLNERLDALQAAGYNKDQISEIRGSIGTPGMNTNQPTGGASDRYLQAAAQALKGGATPVAPPAPAPSPGLAAPQGSMLPQALGPRVTNPGNLPQVPGLQNLFQGMPQGQQSQ